ncbi:hypothetical protein [Stenotrophomonas lactitubi]|uniref:hypothetical protein n=1 Tax=Stenotrophomonas lactitubi TaxID=2045214 RepID=UPI001E061257|nr:hypothetical protein [Stenotrophomonas lactitubi]CAH0175446.1 hypothetical protein SRABI81_01328 [Stenotrophomonas lactitubi]CAH0175725.1 hypothetical protein SRABI122_01296 [Stenotrophomonas lactitubi]CAH0193889.1 hypothetical protein SRABI102_01585 [Stenotrophomonas lactitubi]CAH0228360.1 hypothetical protein SRABI66_02624 [Stenotrophomonas lactitubi]
MTASVVVDFSKEPEFPKKPTGETPKVELVREQLATYVEGYQLARKTAPARIVLQTSDFKHCLRRILARMQKPHRDQAKAAWQERRKAGSQEKWRDAKPEPITAADLTWAGIPIESVGYSRHRAVDKS